MAKYDTKFQLKSPKFSQKTVIRLRMAFDYIDFTWELNDSLNRKLKIYPVLWDFKKQYPIPRSKVPKKFQGEIYNLQVIEQTIDKVKVVASQIINEAALNEIKITANYLKNELLVRLGLAKRAKGITVYDFSCIVVEEMEKGTIIIEKTNSRYTDKTIKQYKVLSRLLEAKYQNLTFNEIDKDWFNNFKLFLLDGQEFTYKNSAGQEKVFSKKPLRDGAMGNYIKNLGVIMRIALDKGISKNMNNKADWFTKPPANPSGKTEVYLTESEIEKIYNFTPKSIKNKKGQNIGESTLEKAKDLFLLGCYTGLRVSDYNNRLSKDNFTTSEKGTNILIKPTQKTGDKVYIPIYWEELTKIAQKYDYEFPKMSDQKINDYIKLICKEVNCFNDIVEYYDKIGGVKEFFRQEKWELITTHTGRRSAVSNLIKNGLSESEVAKFTGHKKQSITELYNKISNIDTADMLMEKLNNNKKNENQ